MDQEKSKPKIYSAEFRESSVKLATGSDKPITQTAKDLGVNANTLHTWINKYSQPKEYSKTVRTDEHLYEELKQLKKENALLIEERDLLKKSGVLCQGATVDCMDAGGRATQEQLPRSTPGSNNMRANFRLNRCAGS